MVVSRSIITSTDCNSWGNKQSMLRTWYSRCFHVASTLPARYARGSDKHVERAHVQMMYSCVVCVRGGGGVGGCVCTAAVTFSVDTL